MNQTLKIEPDSDFIKLIRRRGGDSLKKCYQCATCSAVCGLSNRESPFPRKEMLMAQWGLKDRLMADPDVWLCYQCGDCTRQCPREARPGDTLAAVRSAVIESYAVPGFMGKLAASPKGLPVLFLFAALVVFALVWWTGERRGLEAWGWNAPLPASVESGGYEGGYFGNFLEHGPVEMVFIGGNLLIFSLAGLGLWRFWKDMTRAYGGAPRISFIAAAIATVKEVLSHHSFKECEANRPRYLAHLLVFYGFLGAMATAGLAVLDMIVLGHQPPIPFFHPIKILGNLSFLALFVGSLILIVRRLTDKENVGRSSYADWVFLIFLMLVTLTGGLTQLGRSLGASMPAISYTFYFVHMTAVFFLLWYMPYSKFAHMLYRALGIVFARSSGRTGQ